MKYVRLHQQFHTSGGTLSCGGHSCNCYLLNLRCPVNGHHFDLESPIFILPRSANGWHRVFSVQLHSHSTSCTSCPRGQDSRFWFAASQRGVQFGLPWDIGHVSRIVFHCEAYEHDLEEAETSGSVRSTHFRTVQVRLITQG
jgi:hypothetical protein